MLRSRFLLHLVIVVALFGADGRLDALLAAEQNAKSAQTDADRIRGHWVAAQMWEGGKKTGPNGAEQVVFTDKEMKLPGASWEYQLDPKQAPRQLDLQNVNLKVVNQPAIYRFDGENLWLSIPKSSGAARPDDFDSKPGDGRVIFLLERGKPTSDGRPLYIPPTLKLADENLTGELQKRVSSAAEILEKERYAEFLKEFLPPDELKELLKREKKTVEELVKDPLYRQRVAPVAQLLRAMEKKTPVVVEADNWAYFDLRDVHFNGAPPRAVMLFHKVDGAWRITEKTPDLPRK
jgi:uncharacterized protein (TIGR03067 family)